MSHMLLYVHGKKVTTRDGTHPDDEAYINQVKGQIGLKLAELGFPNAHVELGWDNGNGTV